MSYSTKHIAQALREAREAKGLSQRELSQSAGVPQSHISKIENGNVDLRLTSLVELARALDLELTLVPRKTVPAVQSIVRASATGTSPDRAIALKARKELTRLRNTIDHPSHTALARDKSDQFHRYLRELQHFRLSQSDLKSIQEAHKALTEFLADPANRNAIEESLKQIRELRNHLVHQRPTTLPSARPAYSLDEDDNA